MTAAAHVIPLADTDLCRKEWSKQPIEQTLPEFFSYNLWIMEIELFTPQGPLFCLVNQ